MMGGAGMDLDMDDEEQEWFEGMVKLYRKCSDIANTFTARAGSALPNARKELIASVSTLALDEDPDILKAVKSLGLKRLQTYTILLVIGYRVDKFLEGKEVWAAPFYPVIEMWHPQNKSIQVIKDYIKDIPAEDAPGYTTPR
jgi:hypothetical protein